MPKNQNGFSLIEVLVALAIFAIGIIACYTMQVKSSGTSGRANSIQTSSTWATYLVEDFLALDYSDPLLENSAGDATNGLLDIDDAIGSGDTPDGVMHIKTDGSVSPVAAAGDLFSVFWNVVDNRPLDGLKQIRVIVVKNGGMNSGILYSHDYYKLSKNL